jgi:hypothetical protein
MLAVANGPPLLLASLGLQPMQPARAPDYSAAIALHAGHTPSLLRCGGAVLRVREWRLCLPVLQAHVDAGTCVAYIFGVDTNSPIADVLATRGCEVHAFDPSRDCTDPKRWMNECYHRDGSCYETIEQHAHHNLTAVQNTPHPPSSACRKRPGLHPRVRFRHWGLLSGVANESAFHSQAKYAARPSGPRVSRATAWGVLTHRSEP